MDVKWFVLDLLAQDFLLNSDPLLERNNWLLSSLAWNAFDAADDFVLTGPIIIAT